MDVWCVCAFFGVYVVLCVGRGLATSWSPVQGVLPTVNDQETEKSALCSKKVEQAPKWEQRERKNIVNFCTFWLVRWSGATVLVRCYSEIVNPEVTRAC
jgi:hypothetical protein